MSRVLLALLVLAALTAFAPAPFPKRGRSVPNTISLETMRGTWRVLDFESVTNGNGRSKIGQWFQKVRIDGDQWYYVASGEERTPYRIVVDGTKRPASIDFYTARAVVPGMVGLVKREGSRLTILYYGTQPQNRATNFENPPLNWWVLTLERQN